MRFNPRITKTILIVLLIAIFMAKPAESLAGKPWDWAGDRFKDLIGALKGVAELALDPFGWAIDKVAKAVLNALLAFIFGTILAVTGTIYLLATALLQFILSPDFFGIKITSPGDDPNNPYIIYEVWRMVRDFTNMFFVLALVAIGIGTALRYGEYQLQRALPRLIFIALLINFTPIIVGFFIDAANIVIRFLITESTGKNFWEWAKRAYDGIGELFSLDIFTRSPVQTAAAATAMMFFHIIGTIIFILFFILFLFRFVALNILFILSPLAFFSWILPVTRSFWNRWWNQFIAWLIVGISGAFFIWLASQITVDMWDLSVDVADNPFAAFFNTLIVGAVPIAFLIMGFLFTVQTSAMGASVATGMVQSWTRKASAWAREEGSQLVKRVGQRATIATAQAQKREERMRLFGRGPEIPGTGAIRKAGWYATAPTRWAARVAAPYAIEARAKAEERELSEAKKIISPERKLAALRWRFAAPERRSALLQAAIEQKQIKDLHALGFKDDEYIKVAVEARTSPEALEKFVYGAPTREIRAQIKEQINQIEGFDQQRQRIAGEIAKAATLEMEAVTPRDKEIARMLRERAEGQLRLLERREGILRLSDEDRRRFGDFEGKLIATARPEHIENWNIETFIDPITKRIRKDVEQIMASYWQGRHYGAAAKTFGSPLVDEIMRAFDERGEEWFKKYNREPLLRYLGSTSAQELGLRPPARLNKEPTAPPPGPLPRPSPGVSPGPRAEVQPPRRPRKTSTRPAETAEETE